MTTIETARPLATTPLTPAFATATAGEIELLAYFLKRQAEALAWVAEDPANRFSSAASGEYTVEYIRDCGWADLAAYLLEQARCEYAELHKDIHGIKGRWAFGWTLEQCEEGLRQLERDAEYEARWRRQQEEERLREEAFEAELKKGAPDLSPEPDLHEFFAGVFRLGA